MRGRGPSPFQGAPKNSRPERGGTLSSHLGVANFRPAPCRQAGPWRCGFVGGDGGPTPHQACVWLLAIFRKFTATWHGWVLQQSARTNLSMARCRLSYRVRRKTRFGPPLPCNLGTTPYSECLRPRHPALSPRHLKTQSPPSRIQTHNPSGSTRADRESRVPQSKPVFDLSGGRVTPSPLEPEPYRRARVS